MNKALAKILSDSSFKANITLDDVFNDYLDHLEEKGLKPAENDKKNYVGIEIECFTNLDEMEIFEHLVDLGIDEYVQMTDDGSVEPDFGRDVELRVLLPEAKLASGLKQLGKLFKRDQFGVNDSCGLHIHLDMRNRNVDKCYDRLLKFQDVLFGMVKPERWQSDYCHYVTQQRKASHDRYLAINKNSAYACHKTIEVRLHHGTLDVKAIEKWASLLLRIIGTKSAPKIKSKADVLRWASKNKKIKGYVAKNFKETWFGSKKHAVNDECGSDDEEYF